MIFLILPTSPSARASLFLKFHILLLDFIFGKPYNIRGSHKSPSSVIVISKKSPPYAKHTTKQRFL